MNTNVMVTCPECEGTGLGSWVASCVSDERRPCPVCEGRKKVPAKTAHDGQTSPGTDEADTHPKKEGQA